MLLSGVNRGTFLLRESAFIVISNDIVKIKLNRNYYEKYLCLLIFELSETIELKYRRILEFSFSRKNIHCAIVIFLF